MSFIVRPVIQAKRYDEKGKRTWRHGYIYFLDSWDIC